MTNYNFDTIIPRRGTNSYKWDNTANAEVLPMWVADMDFRTAPAIIDALQQRVQHGIFGYTHVPDAYYDAVINWFSRRHGWNIQREWIIYTTGVVPAISATIKALTVAGDKVLIQTPVYNCFFSSIYNNECETACNPLIYANQTYTIDYEDLERKAADPNVKLLLLCNPHNPAGRVWTKDELTKIGNICLRHNLTIIADEIHCELTYPNHDYTPFASLSEEFQQHTVTCLSASKAFNIAGLQTANIVAPDENIRKKIDRAININEVCDINSFGVVATIAAYNEGEEWLNQLTDYLYANYQYMKAFCEKHLPDFQITRLEGTYLIWMNCQTLGINSKDLEQVLIDKAKLWLNAGTMYGQEGEGFMRWNIACPRSSLQEGLERFLQFVRTYSA